MPPGIEQQNIISMTLSFKSYDPGQLPDKNERQQIAKFLSDHLQQYGDPMDQIQKAIDYSLGIDNKPGGLIITASEGDQLVGATVMNKTGMEGYIPENILVYIATHQDYRGKGVGRQLMESAIRQVDGNIALHVEPDNPAKKLYEKLGFTHKYLEMRINK